MFWLAVRHIGSYAPTRDQTIPYALQGKVLTTGWPGKLNTILREASKQRLKGL